MPVPPTPDDDGEGSHFRRQPRAGGRLAVRWRLDPDDSDELAGSAAEGETTNVGAGGAFIETAAPPSVGTALELTVQLPGSDRPLTLGAEVRWVSDVAGSAATGMGVAFTAITEEALGRLTEYFGTLVETVDHDDIR